MNLLEALVNAIRLPELRNKLLFTGGILVMFRLFANVAVPGASQAALANLFNSQALLGLLDLFSGGGLSRFSVVAMGMNPYINATIIMQLMTVISERIKEISKEGEAGRRRITKWSRYLTVALGAGQAYGFTVLFQNTTPAILPALDWFARLQIVLARPDGTRVWVLPYPEPLRDASGEIVGAVNMLVDITKLKLAEEALRESEHRWRSLTEALPQLKARGFHEARVDGVHGDAARRELHRQRARERELRVLRRRVWADGDGARDGHDVDEVRARTQGGEECEGRPH